MLTYKIVYLLSEHRCLICDMTSNVMLSYLNQGGDMPVILIRGVYDDNFNLVEVHNLFQFWGKEC